MPSALEPACSGLTLTLWTAHITEDERRDAMLSAGWWLYNNGGVMYRYGSPQGSLDYKHTTLFSITAQTDRRAVQQVCFVMKGKGGKVR